MPGAPQVPAQPIQSLQGLGKDQISYNQPNAGRANYQPRGPSKTSLPGNGANPV